MLENFVARVMEATKDATFILNPFPSHTSCQIWFYFHRSTWTLRLSFLFVLYKVYDRIKTKPVKDKCRVNTFCFIFTTVFIFVASYTQNYIVLEVSGGKPNVSSPVAVNFFRVATVFFRIKFRLISIFVLYLNINEQFFFRITTCFAYFHASCFQFLAISRENIMRPYSGLSKRQMDFIKRSDEQSH